MAKYLALDVGDRRVGVAMGDSQLKMAWPLTTIVRDGAEQARLGALMKEQEATEIVVGRPRNQRGEPTQQTAAVENFVQQVVSPLGVPTHWQDESVTSVIAEERLQKSGKAYAKEDIDAEAAAIILQDFLEANP